MSTTNVWDFADLPSSYIQLTDIVVLKIYCSLIVNHGDSSVDNIEV